MYVNKLVAHRGDNTNFPENSYAAFESALKAGSSYIEFDVQMNADGSLIVFHDTDLKRMTNSDHSIFDMDDSEIMKTCINSQKGQPVYIPTLKEILKLLANYPDAQAFVELKKQSIKKWGFDKVMQKLIAELKDYSHQIYLISYSSAALEYTHQHSNYRTGLVFNKFNEKKRKIAKSLKPDFLICPYKIVRKKELWKGNWQWMVYSLNDISLVNEVFKRGDIDLIETDDIQLMLSQGSSG